MRFAALICLISAAALPTLSSSFPPVSRSPPSPFSTEENRPTSYSPESLSYDVMGSILESPSWFLNHELMWTYGAALINDGFHDMVSQWPNNTLNAVYNSQVDVYLDHYYKVGHEGFKILHDTWIYDGYSIGDRIGLYPISYLNRYDASPDPNPDDLRLAQRVAQKHILGWSIRTSLGTIARHVGWDSLPDGPSPKIWADDSFMGLTLLSRLARGDNLEEKDEDDTTTTNTTTVSAAIDFVSDQLVDFAKKLGRPDGLSAHGYAEGGDDGTSGASQSCCAWGRANGWLLMSFVETLTTLAEYSDRSDRGGGGGGRGDFEKVKSMFEDRAKAIRDRQDRTTGLWNQVLDEETTFLETSASAMFVYAFAEGARRGFLPAAEYHDAIVNGWEGVSSRVDEDGKVQGICQPTGVKDDVEAYNSQKTDYWQSQESIGAVLKAAVAFDRYMSFYKEQSRSDV